MSKQNDTGQDRHVQTEPLTREELRALVREEIAAWWTSGRPMAALKRAESTLKRGDSVDEERIGSADIQVDRAEVVVESQRAESVDESLSDGQSVGNVRELGQVHESSPTTGGCGDHSVGETGPAEDSAEPSADTAVSDSAEVLLDRSEPLVGLGEGSDEQGNSLVPSLIRPVDALDNLRERVEQGPGVRQGLGDVGASVDIVGETAHDSSPSVDGCGDHSVGETGPVEDPVESSAGTPATSAEVRLDWPGSTAKAALVSDAEGTLYVAAKTPVGMVGDEAHEFANLIRHLSEVAQLACDLRVAPSTDDSREARQPDMTWMLSRTLHEYAPYTEILGGAE